MSGRMSEREAFLWLSGHVRNVGDSMLRRPLAETYREIASIRVWTGAPRSGYVSGLQITEQENMKSFGAWARSYARAVIKGKPAFVFNAGEFVVTKAYFFGVLALAPLLILAAAKGAPIVWVGAGVKSRRRFFMWPFDLLARSATELRWRDVVSPGVMKRGGVMPDWGFGFGPGGGSKPVLDTTDIASREYIAISLRGDRSEPSDLWIDSVQRLAERLGRKLIFVVQVAEDDRLASRLAQRLDADIVQWEDGDHWLQEQRVRLAYSNSVLAISDRLHGLIIATTEGCIPLGWCESTTSKVANHFDVVGAEWVAPGDSPSAALLDRLDLHAVRELASRSTAVSKYARERVENVRRDLAAGGAA